MSNFQDKYKQKRGRANDAATGRMLRVRQQNERRRFNRAENFSRNRDVSPIPQIQVPEIQETSSLDERFHRWKLEKELKRKMDQRNKKPIFKVGIVHHNFYSPIAKDKINNAPCYARGAHTVKTRLSPPKKITRATQKRLAAKMAASVAATSSQPSTSSIALSMTPFRPGKSAAAASATPFQPGTNSAAALSSSFLSSSSVATASASASQPGTSGTALSMTPFQPNRKDMPWPSTHNISVASVLPLNNSNLFRRLNAIESSGWPGTSERFSSKDSPVEEKSRKIELNSQTGATKSQPVESEGITVVETLTCSRSPRPAMSSPYVTTSHGEDGARGERRSKMGIGCTPPDDVPTKETVMRSLNVSNEEEEHTAQYFKFMLQREIERLNEVCTKWEKVKGELALTEDARYLINQAIGQATLLVRNKFKTFRNIVAACETGKSEMLVQCHDLQGFWDMMYIDVENCDSRFQKLDRLQSTGWVEEEIVVKIKRPTGIRRKVVANKFTMNAKSSARSWISAKRKAMSQTEKSGANVISARHNSGESRPATSGNTDSTPREKTRRRVGSSPPTIPRFAKRAIRKITPKKTSASLLKKYQLSETKNVRSPLIVMKINQMCKTPDMRLDETISYINSDQTPSRGTLKKSDETSSTDIAVAKSAHKVDFNDDVVPSQPRVDENLENSINLDRPLSRIENYDSDSSDNVFEPEEISRSNVTLRRIAKRLNVENESISKTSFAVPEIIVSPTSPIYVSTSGAYTSMTTKALESSPFIAYSSNEEKHPEDESSTRRVSRNRSVSVRTSKKSARRSTKSSSARKKIVSLYSSAKENDDPPMIPRQGSLSESSEIFEIECHSEEPSKIRRSTRKSVCFNGADCTAYVDSSKSVHSITPHSRRSRIISLLGDVSRQSIGPQFDGDLISFDSPAAPSRIRCTSQASKKSSQ